MRAIALALLCCAVPIMAQAADGCFTVHGRLAVYNGTPSVRIWVIGTKRILGIPDGPDGHEDGNMPDNVRRFFQTPDFDFIRVFGDYDVCPLTEQKPGEMQIVRLVRARNLVVRNLK